MLKSAHHLQTIKHSGFTLVEVLIAVSILGAVSAITVPNFNGFINDQNLRQAQEAVKNGVRDAQNRAISGVDSNTVCSSPNLCNYWVFWYNDGDSRYRISRTYVSTPSPDAASCNALNQAHVESDMLQAGATFQTPSNSRSCVFFRMISADVTFINLLSGGDNTVRSCITPGNNAWMQTSLNLAGMVGSVSGQGSCSN